jgi:hypothetical protein
MGQLGYQANGEQYVCLGINDCKTVSPPRLPEISIFCGCSINHPCLLHTQQQENVQENVHVLYDGI